MNIARLKEGLKGLEISVFRETRGELIKEFIDSLPASELEFYRTSYEQINSALKEHRQVTKAINYLSRRGIFIQDTEVSIYYQIGCVIFGEPPITPSEAIKKMNKNSPRQRKNSARLPPIFDKIVSPDFEKGFVHEGEKDRNYG